MGMGLDFWGVMWCNCNADKILYDNKETLFYELEQGVLQ